MKKKNTGTENKDNDEENHKSTPKKHNHKKTSKTESDLKPLAFGYRRRRRRRRWACVTPRIRVPQGPWVTMRGPCLYTVSLVACVITAAFTLCYCAKPKLRGGLENSEYWVTEVKLGLGYCRKLEFLFSSMVTFFWGEVRLFCSSVLY